MNKRSLFAIAIAAALILAVRSGPAQTPAARAQRPAEPTHVRNSEVGWRLAPSEQQYAGIDGQHLKDYVEEICAISRRYRDAGHQFWGRITGTEADAENARWMLDKFRQIGLSDVHEQVLDLPPQWMPQSWSVVATANGKTLPLGTAQPTYLAVGTDSQGLNLEAVYVGLGSDADLALSRDVRGKAVFFYSTDLASRHAPIADNAIRRLGDRGAAAIFVIQGLPGNEKTQFYPVNSPVPTFSLGQKDGLAMRDFIAQAGAGEAHVKILLDVKRVPNLKSAMIWGTLPGMTDENDIVVAHRDGWFEGANDNAAGMATLIGMAEYFAKLPKEQRRRSIIFLGTNGHHDNGAESGAWLLAHPEVFAKTAVLFNAEHTGGLESAPTSGVLSNAPAAYRWYGTGPILAGIVVKAMDAFGVPSFPQSSPSPPGEIGRYYHLAPSVEIINSAFVWHSDQETPQTISTSGLAAVTRAYAKVILDSNAIDLKELRAALTPRQ
ncbi:MAG TPA: M28 family peptidase [Bryobacteraceae bacterium]|nr:M28 family peptidase [Bryobacteraceae bacterium]